jgi:biotin carboxylase
MRDMPAKGLPMPFVIKPAVGFFSMGVHKVSSPEQWGGTVDLVLEETRRMKGLYPREVINSASFIIEQCIDGEEFAVDAYFNSDGKAVVLGIYKHIFSSAADVSDRIYMTSADIIRET